MNTDRPIQVERPVFPPQGARPVSSLASRRSLASFTLIELLVVVAVILILMGISMKVLSIANRHATKGKTLFVLEQVKNALGAYYTQYGVYPPVDAVRYEYPDTLAGSMPATPDAGMGYTTGLVYYIYSGGYYNPDPAAAAWQHYLDGLGSSGSDPKSGAAGASFLLWTNKTHTIKDGWGADLNYQCKSLGSSCQRFRLWSSGGPSLIEVTSD
jgi:prepilin-type N-terminal cleavage/methylation domain-containing protein